MRELRPWTADDNAKLKVLAGKVDRNQIAMELGRSVGATVVQASKLKISLRLRGNSDADRKQSANPA